MMEDEGKGERRGEVKGRDKDVEKQNNKHQFQTNCTHVVTTYSMYT